MNSIPERRLIGSNTPSNRASGMRRNLFDQQLSRRPTLARSSNLSIENLGTDLEIQSDNSSEIVIRDDSGNLQIGVTTTGLMHSFNDQETDLQEAREEEEDKQRLNDAIKLHQRDRDRALNDTTELLEAVKKYLKTKVAALAEDNWLYEVEHEMVAP